MKLHDAGLVRCNGGDIEVLDRPGLETRVRVLWRSETRIRPAVTRCAGNLKGALRATFQECHMRYQMGDTSELTYLLLSVFTELPQPGIVEGLHRYLWRHLRFGYVEQLADALEDVRSGSAGHFLYHKKSGFVFAHVEYGHHQLLLAHLCALHKTDLSVELVKWNVQQFRYSDPVRRLADDFVCDGYGLLLSTLSDRNLITVRQTFAWEPLERTAFGRFEQDVI
jgi:hypothetical protein